MKRKPLALFITVLLVAVALTACSEVSVKIGEEQLNFLKADVSESYEGIVPADGNSILTLRFVAQNPNPDLTKISDAFFGETPCTLSNGNDTYPCKSIAFENNGGKIDVLPIFEVPSSLKGSGTMLTLSGSAFSPIQIKV